MAFPPPLIRSGSSGPIALPAPGRGVRGFAWGAPITLTLMPAGHYPGLYVVSFGVFNTIAAGAGNYTSLFSWSQPDVGAATLAFGAVNLTATGLIQQLLRALESDGSQPIVWTATPAGLGGAVPSSRINVNATLVAGLVP